MFSRIDCQAVTQENGSANLSSPSCGVAGIDSSSAITRNIAHECMTSFTTPLGHRSALAAASIFSRHILSHRKRGLVRELEPISWSKTPTVAEREAAREQRRLAAEKDEQLQALPMPPRPYQSSYELEHVPTAADREELRFAGDRTYNRNFRPTFLPSTPTYIVAVCYGCLKFVLSCRFLLQARAVPS